MNQIDYERLSNDVAVSVIQLGDLKDQSPRTLIFGYDCDRNTFHVYIDPKDQLIHVALYSERFSAPDQDAGALILSHTFGVDGGASENKQFLPNKRIYGESCDFEFCMLLKQRGETLPFTTFDAEKAGVRQNMHKGFAGRRVGAADHLAVRLSCETPSFMTPRGYELDRFARPSLASRLLAQACADLGVQYVQGDTSSTFFVAKVHAADVLKKAERLDMHLITCAEDSAESAASQLAVQLFGYESTAEVIRSSYYQGVLSASFSAPGVELRPLEEMTRYISVDGSSSVGVTGTYEGRPMFITQSSEGAVELTFSQFGGTIALWERWNKRFTRSETVVAA